MGRQTGTKKKKLKKERALREGFEDWYAIYPRKKSRADAERAFTKAVPSLIALPALMEKTRAFAASWESKPEAERKFIPYPASWLNAGSYDDEPEGEARRRQLSATPERTLTLIGKSAWIIFGTAKLGLRIAGDQDPVSLAALSLAPAASRRFKGGGMTGVQAGQLRIFSPNEPPFQRGRHDRCAGGPTAYFQTRTKYLKRLTIRTKPDEKASNHKSDA